MSTQMRPRDGIAGAQWIYRFANGYGASVVQGPYSYGGRDGLYDLAVIKYEGDDWSLTYETPITDDVLGHLSVAEVAELLARIAALSVSSVSDAVG